MSEAQYGLGIWEDFEYFNKLYQLKPSMFVLCYELIDRIWMDIWIKFEQNYFLLYFKNNYNLFE